jgi:hypothetical protein
LEVQHNDAVLKLVEMVASFPWSWNLLPIGASEFSLKAAEVCAFFLWLAVVFADGH